MAAKDFSKSWKGSSQPRRQRKYRHNAPLHIKQKMVHVHLSPELRGKYGKRNTQVRTGDKVKVLRGKFDKKEGKVERVHVKGGKVFVTGIDMIKKDGTKIHVALDPSNLMITSLDLSDKRRGVSSKKGAAQRSKASSASEAKLPAEKKVEEKKK